MKKKAVLYIKSEGIPFGFSASANKVRYIGEIFAQSQIDVYCLNKRQGGNERRIGCHQGIKFAFFNSRMKSRSFLKMLLYL